MTGQRTGRLAHDSGTPRGLGCLQTWKGEVKTMYGSTNSEGGSMKINVESESKVQSSSSERRGEQYSLAKILGIWALAAVPMGILNWIVFPLLAPGFESHPFRFGITLVVLLTLGLIWLFVLSMIMVRREEGDLHWATLKRRLRLNAPRELATGQPRARLWLWVVPFLVAVAVVELVLNTPLEDAWVSLFPFLAEPHGYSFDAFFGSQEILQRLEDAWWFLALIVVMSVFNTILGRSFSFGACCCPRWKACSDAAAGWRTAYSSLSTTFTSPGGYRTLSSPASCTPSPHIATGAHGCLSSSTLHRVCTSPS